MSYRHDDRGFDRNRKRRNYYREGPDGDDGKRARVTWEGKKDPKRDALKLISDLGRDDPKRSIESSLEFVAGQLTDDERADYEADIVQALSDCVLYKPERLTVYSTLVGLLNQRKNSFGGNFLSKLSSEMDQKLHSNEFDLVSRIITFIADLSNSYVITIDSLIEFFLNILDNAVDYNLLNDFYIYSLIHALPWIGATLEEKNPDALNEIILSIDRYISSRTKNYLKILGVWDRLEGLEQEDYIDSLWAQIKKLKEDKWLEQHINRYYVGFDSVLSEAVSHNLPSIDLYKFDPANVNYPLPRVVFRFFRPSDCLNNPEPPLPDNHAIERFLVEDDINLIIANNFLNFKICAKELLNYHKKDSVPIYYIIVEVVFGHLLRLPKPAYLEVFYGALLIELCRHDTENVPPVLAQAIELLYRRSKSLQLTGLDRLVDWFSYHLSNFGYRWSWNEWADSLEMSLYDPRRIFVTEVLEKCLHFSYLEKLTQILPAEYGPILPAEPKINYAFDDSGHPLFQKAQTFQNFIKDKTSSKDILLELQVDRLATNNVQYDSEGVAIFTAVVLKMASKTVSHTFAAFTKYVEVFRCVSFNNREMQSLILRVLFECWHSHKQLLTILADKLIKMRIVEPFSVVAWGFSDDMIVELHRFWIWEVINVAIYRLHCQLNVLNKDIEHLKVQKERQKKFEGIVDSSEFEDVTPMLVERQQELVELNEGTNEILSFLIEKFNLLLTEISTVAAERMDDEHDEAHLKVQYIVGRFKQFLIKNSETIFDRNDFLHSNLFTLPQMDSRLVEIYDQFSSLKYF